MAILNILSSQAVALTAEEEEMKVLRMYFNEDQLVISPTRTLKRLSQVAENMEIVTAQDIERMNAHTVAEVLERVTGLFVSFYGHDFGSDATVHIQGSSNKHVLVLLDGIPWNSMTEGKSSFNNIPVMIIKRIEIIKGPASSAWGSSLGGVINIITKETEKDSLTGGVLSASYGERATYDLRAEFTGDTKPVRYYLYAGRQESDGLRKGRWFDNDTFYAKLNLPVSSGTELMFTAGYSEPHINDGYNDSDFDQIATSINRDSFATANLSSELTNALSFDASVYLHNHKFSQEVDELAGTWSGTPGAMLKDTIINQKRNGAGARLVYRGLAHTLVLGSDYSYGNSEMRVHSGEGMIYWYGADEYFNITKSKTKWAVYVNDTITFGRFSITPGIRHDYSSISGDFLSPSIGATYRASAKTILKASMSKGFNEPHLAASASGGLFLDPNPDLISEKIWSYQAGLESWALNYLKVKLNLFHHDIENDLYKISDKYFNMDRSKRDGVEIDIRTAPFHDISLKTGYAFVHQRIYYIEDTSTDYYLFNMALRYDDLRSLFAELAGHYLWWKDTDSTEKARYDTFIWDLNMNKKIYSANSIQSNLFLTVHNIFNGSQYVYDQKKNPARWIEAGMRVEF